MAPLATDDELRSLGWSDQDIADYKQRFAGAASITDADKAGAQERFQREYGQSDANGAGLAAYLQLRNQGADHESAYQSAVKSMGWTPGGSSSSSGTGGSGGSGTSLIDPFTQPFNAPKPTTSAPAYVPQTPSYTAPSYTAPVFKPPDYVKPPEFSYSDYTKPTDFAYPDWQQPADFTYNDFAAPDAQSVLNAPGYQFRLNQGEQALTNARAAQGILGTGSTLKDILGYGQDYASNEYQGEYNREANTYNTNRQGAFDAYKTNTTNDYQNYITNRTGAFDTYNTNAENDYKTYMTNRQGAVDTYNTNYGTQYTDPYRYAYQAAVDAFTPQMAQFQANVNAGNAAFQANVNAGQTAYSTQAAAGQHQTDQDMINAWNQYLFDYNKYRNQKLDTFGMQSQAAFA